MARKNPPLELSFDELAQLTANSYNRQRGDLSGYNCEICKNKGLVACVEGSREFMRVCACMEIRNSMQRIQKSGLSTLLEKCTFESYVALNEWQRQAKSIAMRFVDNHPHSEWMFVGGQVGAGKTHLCTAAVGKFLKAGKSSRYMLWRDDSVRLKAIVNNDAEYAAAINPLKTADVLYIDDFFKTEKNKSPTTADINLAHELLNYRYINRNLVTIISSELFIDDLIDIDQAVGSRIYELSKENYCFHISYDKEKNYRLR